MICVPPVVFGAPMILALVLFGSERCVAQDQAFEVGFRSLVIIGDGQPANDMIGYGVVGRWKFLDSWHVGLAFDAVTFDYETPYRVLGIDSVEEIDPSNEFSRIAVLVERRYGGRNNPWTWFWTAGAGFALIDVGPNAVGTMPGGQPFDIATTADDELHFIFGGGLHRSLGEHWALEAALTIQHHTTDYQLVDLVSGAADSIGSQTPYGLTLGINYRL